MLEAGDLISDYGEVYGGTVNETASSISVSGAVRANDQVCSEDLESYRVLSIGFCDHSVSGPTAYYPLNGNAMDASGHGRDGTLYGTTPATDRNGYSSGAIHLDGNQHFVALPAMDIPSSLSIVLWLKTSVADPNQWPVNMFLVDRDICYFARDWSIGIGYGGRVVFNTGRSSEDAPLVSSSIVADGSWHFVCIVRDATEEQKRVFVGEDVDANADFENTAFANQSRPIFLGASVCNTSSHTYFDGDVDDLRIYDRVLTQDEITDLANRP